MTDEQTTTTQEPAATVIDRVNAILDDSVSRAPGMHGTTVGEPTRLDGITPVPSCVTITEALVHILAAREWMDHHIDLRAGWPGADNAAIALTQCTSILREAIPTLDQVAYDYLVTRQDIATLSVGGTASFPVKDPAASGGITSVFVERLV